jgi:Uma2 family endonuclease
MNVRQSQPAGFTNAEFDRIVRSGGLRDLRVELRRGMIQKMNPQYRPHARVKQLLSKAIEAGLTAAGLDWIVYNECSVELFEGFMPATDIVVWDPAVSSSSEGPVPRQAVRLIVEVADTTLGDDLGPKREDYARGAIAEYWVADVKGVRILRHAKPAGSAFELHHESKFGEAFISLAYPALRFDTASLLV